MQITVSKDSELPLFRQIYLAVQERILNGFLKPGTRVPSSRELAGELSVSRTSVVEAYEQLEAEGYLETRTGSGTFVAELTVAPEPPSQEETATSVNALSFDAFSGFRTDIIDFRTGLPDLQTFPMKDWQAATRRALESLKPRDLAYGRPEGLPELRDAIASYLRRKRGIPCTGEDILVAAGTTQAIGLVARMLVADGKGLVILEDPITADIRRIVGEQGAAVLGVPVDGEGMRTEDLPPGISPAFVYVTPSHQFPLGAVLPARRRLELVKYCRERSAYIVEDDYDSEFRFSGPPLGTLKALDPERVIYIGSFSKTLFPALRIAFLVLPHALRERAREEKWFIDLHNPVIEQKALAIFIESGHFERHIRRMRSHLEKKRNILVGELASAFGEGVRIRGTEAGLHLAAEFTGIRFDEALVGRIEKEGLKVYPASIHDSDGKKHSSTLLFGFGMLPPERIRQGIAILAEILHGLGIMS